MRQEATAYHFLKSKNGKLQAQCVGNCAPQPGVDHYYSLWRRETLLLAPAEIQQAKLQRNSDKPSKQAQHEYTQCLRKRQWHVGEINIKVRVSACVNNELATEYSKNKRRESVNTVIQSCDIWLSVMTELTPIWKKTMDSAISATIVKIFFVVSVDSGERFYKSAMGRKSGSFFRKRNASKTGRGRSGAQRCQTNLRNKVAHENATEE